MNIEKQLTMWPNLFDNNRTKREIRNKMTVHYIKVQYLHMPLNLSDVLTKPGKIGA